MQTSRRPLPSVRDLVFRALRRAGHNEEDAHIGADVIMYAEMRGNNQGIIKLVSGSLCASNDATEIKITFESPLSARISGGQRLGMSVVHKAVSLSIDKARVSGMSIVGCSEYSSATGALGVWAKMIADAGMIGIVLSQCPEMVAPHGSFEPIFGTNPIAIGVPTQPRPQILDMATAAIAYFGIKTAEAAGESIPNDVAYDSAGFPTSDPSAALKGAIRVFDRGHKGSHLALMVELLAGAFTGAAMTDKQNARNWGTLVISIDANIFGNREEFLSHAQQMCDRVKHAHRLPGQSGELYLPGERGDQLHDENVALDSLPLSDDVFNRLQAMVV